MSLQNPGDKNRQVKFIKWDAERRPREDILDLENVIFELGEFQRVVDDDLALIDWKTGNELVRSLHYQSEFEEYKVPVYKVGSRFTPEEEIQRKINYIREKGLVAKRNDKQERYFVDKQNRVWSTKEVNRRYQSWDLSEIVMERLAIIVTLDTDYAHDENQVGFSKFDTQWGHKLYDWYKSKGFWTIPMLKESIKLVHKYRKQIELHAMAKGTQLSPLASYNGLEELEQLGVEYLDEVS